MKPDLLLVVDGGGTKTRALITDLEGNVVARGLGPSSNVHSVGLESFGRALTSAIENALRTLGDAAAGEASGWSGRFAAACFGIAGVDSAHEEAQVSDWVRAQALAPRFLVVNDAELILAGGTPDHWGVALISGTGSVCLGRSRDGRTTRVGGWGAVIGDEGSGYDVAIRALRLALHTADGRADAPSLLQAALDHWSQPDPYALMRHIHAPTTSGAEIAGLAAVMLKLAATGDAAAKAIVEAAGSELAAHVRTVIRKLAFTRPPLALGGGLLRGQLRQALLAALRDEVGPVQYVEDPTLGAVALARRLLLTQASPS